MDWVSNLTNAPFANILFLAGLAFLAVGVIGKVVGKIEPDRLGRLLSGILGVALIVLGFYLRAATDRAKEQTSKNTPVIIENQQPGPKPTHSETPPAPKAVSHASRTLAKATVPALTGPSSGCARESQFKSPASDETAQIGITNASATVVRLFWISYEGKRILYGALAPGEKGLQSTYVGHAWVVAAGPNDDCKQLLIAGHGLTQFAVQ